MKSPYIGEYIEHHTKYIETHGVDETVWITRSEHLKIDHKKLFPMVTPEELAAISRKAYLRTEKAKQRKEEIQAQERARIPTDKHMSELARSKPII